MWIYEKQLFLSGVWSQLVSTQQQLWHFPLLSLDKAFKYQHHSWSWLRAQEINKIVWEELTLSPFSSQPILCFFELVSVEEGR